ncbi:uncharacterized protein uimc1 [Polymixia lowei]
MSPRKLVNKDDDDISSRKQQKKEKRQEDDIRSDRDDEEELSPTLSPSTRGKRRREREKKARPREMTEEEMMDLALRLSEHEASVAALRRQQEEDAMMKAMEESMGSQTQPCPPSQSQSLIANTDTSSTLPSRRKLFYPAVMGASARKPGVSVESCTVEADLRQEPKRVEDENNNKKKRKRKDGSPLPEMPDLSQTQKIYSQASPSSTPSLTVPSHPTQDSTQNHLCQLHKSPTSPLMSLGLAHKPLVHVPKLSQELLETCKISGFVLCSQESLTSTYKSLPSELKSPTFPEVPTLSRSLVPSTSPTFSGGSLSSENDQGEDGDPEQGSNYSKSPVFGRTSPNPMSLSACEAQVHVSELSEKVLATCETLFSQESLMTCQNSLSCQPKSPIFLGSPAFSLNLAPSKRPTPPRRLGHSNNLSPSKKPIRPKSPVFSETDHGEDGETEWSHGCSASPVFGRTSPVFGRTSPVFGRTSPVFGRASQYQGIHLGLQKGAVASSATEDGESGSEGDYPAGSHRGSNRKTRKPPQCLRKANGIDPDDEDVESTPTHYVRLAMPSKSDNEEEKNDISKELNRAKTELSSDMTLRWSDDDDDTVSGLSPSPIFPEERPLHQPDDQKVSPGPPSPSRSPKHLRCSPVPDTRGVQGLSSFTHETHGSNKQNLPGPSSSSSSKPTSGQQRPETSDRQTATTEGEPRPVQDQGAHSEASDPPGEACGGATVHYYWGVPFCPHGLDPDTYTQVILAQMEVYEKSLKQAQRGLLRKAEWGEAILPEPEKSPMSVSPAESPQLPTSLRRGLRLRGKTASEKISTPPPEEEEEDDKDEGEGQKERDNGNDEEEVDIGDGDVCPETQLSGDDDSTQDLIIASPTGEQPQPKSPSLPELQTSLQTQERQRREEEKEEQEQEEVMEVDVDGESDRSILIMTPNAGQDVRMETEEERSDPEVAGEEEEEEEKKEKDEDDVPQMPVPADPGPAGAPQSPVHNVDCPICQGSFSVTEIELHAAYCDGEGDVAEAVRRTAKEDHIQVSLVPRRKRTRRGVLIGEEKTDPSDLDKTAQRREKCYVCQKTVLLSEYNRHTEVCIQRRSSKTALRGDLLSALQHTDSRGSEAGPSGSNLHCGPGEVIDLRFSEDESGDGESEDASAFRISNSPIRAFTPISEAADCLVDFKQQHSAKQPSQRRRGGGRGGGGFKRKFKQ